MPSSSVKIAARGVASPGCLHAERDHVEEFEDLPLDDELVRDRR